MTQIHTYPDGTQVIGLPPFPELSPKQRAEQAIREQQKRNAQSLQKLERFEIDAPFGCFDELEKVCAKIIAEYLAETKEAEQKPEPEPEKPKRGRPPANKAE